MKILEKLVGGLLLAYVTVAIVLFLRFETQTIGNITYHYHEQSLEQLRTLDTAALDLLETSEIYDDTFSARVFLTNSFTEYAILAPRVRNAFAGAYNFTSVVVVAPSSLPANTVTRNGTENNTRNLSAVLAHEFSHILLQREFGAVQTALLPTWKVEGYADFIANDSSFDYDTGILLFCSEAPIDTHSYQYFEFRLFVTQLIASGKTYAEIAEQNIDIHNVARNARLSLCQ